MNEDFEWIEHPNSWELRCEQQSNVHRLYSNNRLRSSKLRYDINKALGLQGNNFLETYPPDILRRKADYGISHEAEGR